MLEVCWFPWLSESPTPDGAASSWSKGLVERPRFGTSIWSGNCEFEEPAAVWGVRVPDTVPPPSPSLTRDSTVLSRFPLRPFRTVAFFLWSGNPISRSMTSLDSNGSLISPTLVPNTRDCLLDGTGGEGASYSSR
jgi:hypothetical protein